MKKLLSFICVFALCAALFAPATLKAAETDPEKGMTLTVKKMKEQFIEFNAGLAKAELYVSYPVFKIEESAAATKKLNKAMKKFFVKGVKKYYEQPENNEWFDPDDYLYVTVKVNDEVTNRIGNCVSVEADVETRLETSAYGAWSEITCQFDLTTGKKVAFKKLFNTKGLYDYLADYMLDEIADIKEMYRDYPDLNLYYDEISKEEILTAFKQNKIAISLGACYMNIRVSEGILGPHAAGTPDFSIPIDEVMTYSIARDQLFFPLSETRYDFATNGGVPYFWTLEIVSGDNVVGIVDCGTFANENNGPGFVGGASTARYVVYALKPGTAKLKATYVSYSGEVDEEKTQEWTVIVTDDFFLTEANG